MISRNVPLRALTASVILIAILFISARTKADTGPCVGGVNTSLPFTDVGGNFFFCHIAAAYFSGLTTGLTATTYGPGQPVLREQMAAFTTRTLDQSIKRGHTRAALGEWWTNKSINRHVRDTLGDNPRFLATDGNSVWVSNTGSNNVARLDIKTGATISILSGVTSPEQIVIVSGKIYITSFQTPGKIHAAHTWITGNFSPSVHSTVGQNPVGITFDGDNLWTANSGSGVAGSGSITCVRIADTLTYHGEFSSPRGILFDGAYLWVTDAGDASLKRVDTATGAVVQTVPLSGSVGHPIFDGTNLWIPCSGPDQVYVVRAVGKETGTVLAQLTGNGLNGAFQAAFDGERICVTNDKAPTVSLWKASDLSPITSADISGGLPGGYASRGVCSDGITFYIGLRSLGSSFSAMSRL